MVHERAKILIKDEMLNLQLGERQKVPAFALARAAFNNCMDDWE